MADIVEVVHRINYEVNDAGLSKVAEIVKTQLADLQRLNSELARLQQQLKASSSAQGDELEKLAASVGKATLQMERSLGKTAGLLQQFGTGLLKGLGIDQNLEAAVARWITPVQGQLGKLMQGGFAANRAIVTIGKTLFSMPNIVGVAITALTSIAELFLTTSENTEQASEQAKKYMEVQKDMAETIGKEIASLNTLYTTATNTNLAYKQRLEAVDELQRKFPEYFGQIEKEKILNGEAKASYDALTVSIVRRAKAAAQQTLLEKAFTEKIAKENDLARILNPTSDRMTYATDDEVKVLRYEIRQKEDEIMRLQNKMQEERQLEEDAYVLFPGKMGNKNADTGTTGGGGNRSVYLQKERERPKEQEIEKMTVRQITIEQMGSVDTPHGKTIDNPYTPTYTEPYNEREIFLFGDTAFIDDKEERRREEIQKSIDAYQTLVNAAVQAFQTIYDAQIKALDAEIAIRQKRVEAATKLAEKGNTDALKIEQERLDKAQKQREEFARRQQIINAALAVSNAVLAVAQAAGETGPGAIAVVPAVIAAIIAGYAAISAATRESTAQAFADGVVGFRGKGGPRDDANWVRISSGESVITAKGTAANMSILEAINKGAEFRMLDARLISPIPSPNISQTNFASKENLKGLEKKLDGVIEAVRDNQFKQDVFFNEHGVGLLTQKAVRRDQNRFK